VYGDIGTSPLYALKECIGGPHGVPANREDILGVLSLFFWALTLVVSVKYLVFILRADNRGEGGVLALLALVLPEGQAQTYGRFTRVTALIMAGLFGAALLYGDGVITPAISVLSAVEGIAVGSESMAGFVVPVTCAILIALFFFQRRGTSGIGAWFGPVMLVWFATLAALGVYWVAQKPEVLTAISPTHAIDFFVRNGRHGFLLLGAVVLCVTGAEALYADMGHFGRRVIRVAWFSLVFPALLLNYFGQGALLLVRPSAAANPFYEMVGGWMRYPLIVLATIATIVASQALISGIFSLTRQAIQLGYAPRMTIVHTSATTEGQIYIPEMNWLLMVACIALVLEFRSSAALASAYGIAVTGTMIITSLLFYTAMRQVWKWPLGAAIGLLVVFLGIDLAFFTANVPKIASGGWFPLVFAAGGLAIMTTWKRGRTLLSEQTESVSLPLKAFVMDTKITKPLRVPGTAVFMTTSRRGTPVALLHHFKHNKVLHERVFILTMVTDESPKVPRRDRLRFKDFGEGFYGVVAHIGFMESPMVRELLHDLRKEGVDIKENETSFYLGRDTLLRNEARPILSRWRFALFRFLSRNARSPTDFFGLPPNRVIEIGTQFQL
jgi:KUP system potassium uptake protein